MIRQLSAVLALSALSALLVPTASAGFARHSGCTTCSPEQRDAFRTTEEFVERLWLQGRRASQSIRKEGASQKRVQDYHDALKASFRKAWRAHEGFVTSLGQDQRAHFETRLKGAESVRRKCLLSFDELTRLAAESEPDRRLSAGSLERIARQSRDWMRELERISWHDSTL